MALRFEPVPCSDEDRNAIYAELLSSLGGSRARVEDTLSLFLYLGAVSPTLARVVAHHHTGQGDEPRSRQIHVRVDETGATLL